MDRWNLAMTFETRCARLMWAASTTGGAAGESRRIVWTAESRGSGAGAARATAERRTTTGRVNLILCYLSGEMEQVEKMARIEREWKLNQIGLKLNERRRVNNADCLDRAIPSDGSGRGKQRRLVENSSHFRKKKNNPIGPAAYFRKEIPLASRIAHPRNPSAESAASPGLIRPIRISGMKKKKRVLKNDVAEWAAVEAARVGVAIRGREGVEMAELGVVAVKLSLLLLFCVCTCAQSESDC